MHFQKTRSGGEGLERSCKRAVAGWLASSTPVEGVDLAEGLMAAEHGGRSTPGPRVDVIAVERAREFLDAERTRVVHSSELESITGLTRYDLARQFRVMFGTSPHRYLLMRRLAFAH